MHGHHVRRAVLDYNKLSVMIILGAVLYSEYFAYYSAYSRWPSLPIQQKDGILKILFVADPQIQGLLHEGSQPWAAIRRWDADRYLSKGYGWARWAYGSGNEFDLVVFLGDLLDEGSEANDVDFAEYVQRFRNIYDLTDSVNCSENEDKGGCQAVFVPGDNDIGGEGLDPVTASKAARFKASFPSKANYNFHSANVSLDLIPVSALLEKLNSEKEFSYKEVVERTKQPNNIRLVVSHFPIIPINIGDEILRKFSEDVRTYLKPSLVFSAHAHRGMDYAELTPPSPSGALKTKEEDKGRMVNITYYSLLRYQTDKARLRQQTEFQTYPFHQNPSDVIHEVNVPTASYRMGVKEMALGIAIVDLNQSEILWYANLWLPSRFALLFVYIAAVLTAVVLLIVGKVQSYRRGRRASGGSGHGSWKWKRRSSSSSSSPSPRGRRYSRSRSGSRDKAHYSKLV